jgi:hypothetical protein
MKAVITFLPASVYAQPDSSSAVIAKLAVGQELDLGRVTKRGGTEWTSVVLASGEHGYVSGNCGLRYIRRAELAQDEAIVFSEPSASAARKASLSRKAKFLVSEYVESAIGSWIRIKDSSGEGFIDARTRIRIRPSVAEGAATKDSGTFWFLAGILATVVINIVNMGGPRVVGGAMILIGAVRFLRGSYQVRTALD